MKKIFLIVSLLLPIQPITAYLRLPSAAKFTARIPFLAKLNKNNKPLTKKEKALLATAIALLSGASVGGIIALSLILANNKKPLEIGNKDQDHGGSVRNGNTPVSQPKNNINQTNKSLTTTKAVTDMGAAEEIKNNTPPLTEKKPKPLTPEEQHRKEVNRSFDAIQEAIAHGNFDPEKITDKKNLGHIIEKIVTSDAELQLKTAEQKQSAMELALRLIDAGHSIGDQQAILIANLTNRGTNPNHLYTLPILNKLFEKGKMDAPMYQQQEIIKSSLLLRNGKHSNDATPTSKDQCNRLFAHALNAIDAENEKLIHEQRKYWENKREAEQKKEEIYALERKINETKLRVQGTNVLNDCLIEQQGWKFTPLAFAARLGDVEAIDRLALRGANPDVTPKKWDPVKSQLDQGMTPFMQAIYANQPSAVIEALLKAGANPNQYHINGQSAFHRLIEQRTDQNHDETMKKIRILHRYGCNIKATNNEGRTALQEAMHRGADNRIITLLQELENK